MRAVRSGLIRHGRAWLVTYIVLDTVYTSMAFK